MESDNLEPETAVSAAMPLSTRGADPSQRHLAGRGCQGLAMAISLLILLLSAPAASAQYLRANSFPDGSWSFQVWAGGADSLYGWTADSGVITVGVRVTEAITRQHGPGWFRGNLAYGFDVVPIAATHQRGTTVYGGGANPLVLDWNFTSHQNLVPYFEVAGGFLLTNTELPPNASLFNFFAQAGPGVHILLDSKHALNIGARYFHLSNATLGTVNPGMNGFNVTVGYEWFRSD